MRLNTDMYDINTVHIQVYRTSDVLNIFFFFPRPFQFIIHYQPGIQRYTVRVS
jgi:hypothetical protein